MKRAIFLFIFSLLVPNTGLSKGKMLKVAVLDTGLNLYDDRLQEHLCTKGHKDFTHEGLDDFDGHGTHIVGIIEANAGSGNYCLLIYKFTLAEVSGILNVKREVAAIKEAIKNGASIINISAGGPDFFEQEYQVIKQHPEVTFVVAAGNEGQDVGIPGNEYFPASYFLRNQLVVGSINNEGAISPFSNFGRKIKYYEVGENVISTLPYGRYGTMRGTSQSTAIKTGKLIKERLNAK